MENGEGRLGKCIARDNLWAYFPAVGAFAANSVALTGS